MKFMYTMSMNNNTKWNVKTDNTWLTIFRHSINLNQKISKAVLKRCQPSLINWTEIGTNMHICQSQQSPVKAINHTIRPRSVAVPWSLFPRELSLGQVLSLSSLWRGHDCRTLTVVCASSPQCYTSVYNFVVNLEMYQGRKVNTKVCKLKLWTYS